MDLLFNAEFINFSEKEILENAGSDNHLGQGVKRLIFKTVRCTKSFCDENNGEIYRKGQEYKLWIAEYNDKLLGVTCWFTAMPRILDADAIKGSVKTFYMVPKEVFQYAGNSVEKTPFITIQSDYELVRYQLFIDVNDGMQYLIRPWSLKKSDVLAFAVKKLGGSLEDYNIRGRFLCNAAERHIVWLIGRKRKRASREYFFFDVLKQDFISWNIYDFNATMTPISSGQAKIHIGNNTVEANKYEFVYKLGK